MNTNDCRNFLAGFFKRNPTIIPARFGIPSGHAILKTALNPQMHAIDPKNWKRQYKCKPGAGEHTFRYYLLYPDTGGVDEFGEPKHEFRGRPKDYEAERGFELVNTEGAIAFVVLEKKDGTLQLANYIGD